MVNMADITVTFDDGSSHVYRNAPESLSKDDALARIAKTFLENK